MPHRETTAAGAPCWTDLSTSDMPRAKQFQAPEDSPFGRLATLADCCGAMLKIMSR